MHTTVKLCYTELFYQLGLFARFGKPSVLEFSLVQEVCRHSKIAITASLGYSQNHLLVFRTMLQTPALLYTKKHKNRNAIPYERES